MPKRPEYPGHIQERGSGSWRVTLRTAGQRHQYTVQGTRKAAENFARKKYGELERRARRRGPGAVPGGVRFSMLLERFEGDELPTLAPGAQRSYGTCLKAFRRFFVEVLADPPLDQISRGNVKEFASWRRTHSGREGRARVGPFTIQKDLRVLHRLFNFALDLDLVELNPAARVKGPKADPRTPVILSGDELDQLLEAAGEDRPMLRLFILLLAETGLRTESEALRLRWEDLDLPGGFLQVRSGRDGHRTKSGRSRWVPLTSRLRQALQEHAAAFRLATYGGKRSPWVFHHTRTRRRHTAGERIQDLRAGFLGAKKRAKLPAELRMHDLRHRRVTTWLAEGKPATLVKEAVGHASLATTMSYTHLAREHLRDLVEEPEAGAGRAELKELARGGGDG